MRWGVGVKSSNIAGVGWAWRGSDNIVFSMARPVDATLLFILNCLVYWAIHNNLLRIVWSAESSKLVHMRRECPSVYSPDIYPEH